MSVARSWIHLSTVNHPDTWDTQEHGQIVFANPAEAKKAEKLFNDLEHDNARLRSELDAALAAIEEIAEDCKTVAQDESISIAERRTWRIIVAKARAALARQGREGEKQ